MRCWRYWTYTSRLSSASSMTRIKGLDGPASRLPGDTAASAYHGGANSNARCPPDLLGACAAIVEARDRLAALNATAAHSAKIVNRSVELRRQSARLLYNSIRAAAQEDENH